MDLAMEDYRQALRRMAVMLFALAGLAERAAGRSCALRGLVLWLLRPAEAAARAFVVEETWMSGAPVPPAPMALRQGGDSAAEAIRLASCLRALASVLDGLAVRAGRLVARRDQDRGARPTGGFSGRAAAAFRLARGLSFASALKKNGHARQIRQPPNHADTS